MSQRMAEQTKPKRLTAGARIGIVNPAYWLEPDRLQRAVGVFEDLGYDLVLEEIDEKLYAFDRMMMHLKKILSS